MRKWRNDFQCLAGLAGLLLRRQEPHGAHVVQPVGDLDHQHASIARHRDDHLADRLALGGVAQLDLVELGHAVDEVAHLRAELGGQCLERVAGVLDGVVQQRRDQGGGVHAKLGEDVGDGERMRDVRIAGAPQLIGVPLLGHLVGALQNRKVGLRESSRDGPRPAGSSTGFTAPRCAVIRRASRARTRRDALLVVLGVSVGASGTITGIGWVCVKA